MSEPMSEEARQALETAAATLLGKILFEFGHLEVALGLCIVWMDQGRQLDEMTSRIEDFNFQKSWIFSANGSRSTWFKILRSTLRMPLGSSAQTIPESYAISSFTRVGELIRSNGRS
jgi:hypothetical protein